MSGDAEPGTLAAVIERMQGAVDSLNDLACKHLVGSAEEVRLTAKRHGVLLALSYAQQELRLAEASS